MNNKLNKLIRAREKVKALKLFYFHLIIFLIGMPIILFLMFLVEDGEYKNFWLWLILTTGVCWCVALGIHAWSALGGRILFKKSWEDRKIREYLEEEEQLWE